jgi:predicted DNA-binding WGR domain protein
MKERTVIKLEYYNYSENSDKYYHIIKTKLLDNTYTVKCEYGRCGNFPSTTRKTKSGSVLEYQADKIVSKLIEEKLKKGYELKQ